MHVKHVTLLWKQNCEIVMNWPEKNLSHSNDLLKMFKPSLIFFSLVK